jgi:hypothetical protein
MIPCMLHAADVVVSGGAGNVGIGSLSGGTVNLGLTRQEAKALAAATGQELVRQLTMVVQRLNAGPNAKDQRDKISLGAAEAFLAAIKGKKVPQAEWPEVFGELLRQYLQLGSRIEATPVTGDRIKALVARADSARKLGNFDAADALLAEAADISAQDSSCRADVRLKYLRTIRYLPLSSESPFLRPRTHNAGSSTIPLNFKS